MLKSKLKVSLRRHGFGLTACATALLDICHKNFKSVDISKKVIAFNRE